MSEFESNEKVICSFCGEGNAAGTKFCGNCGTKLEVQSSENKTEGETISSPYHEEIQINYETTGPVYSEPQMQYQNTVENNSTVYDSPGYSQENPADNSKGFAIASLCCGIASILCCCLWYISFFVGIAGIVLGIIAMKKGTAGKGMATAGLITSIVGIVLAILAIILVVIIAIADPYFYNNLLYEFY